jgi:multidrug efflux pump subunit AcrB
VNIVAAALRRPVTVIVAMAAILLGATLTLQRMPRDIFPTLSVPVIYVVQPYGGMAPTDIEGQLVGFYEYNFLYLNGIERIESTSIQGMGFVKLYFHEGVDIGEAMAQVTALAERSLANMPVGTRPPFIIRFDTGTLPIAQLVFSSENRSESEIQDLALYRVRPMLATLPGVSAPPPSGGRVRMIVAYLDPDRLRAHNLSAEDVAAALSKANTTLPSGNVRVGDFTAIATTNAMASDPKELENLPLRPGAGAVRLGDVGSIQDGSDIVYNIATLDGRRTVYMPLTKHADASTLDVLDHVKEALPRMRAAVPEDVHVDIRFDQSRHVVGAIRNLASEGTLGALLTGLCVLLFLRNWRSALVVLVTIPLSILAAVVALHLAHQTINIMTLSGLALAVGILVDEATVAIENIHTHLALGKPAGRAVLDAMREVMQPQLLAMLCILAVFLPALFMVGIGKALFPPLALAVGFSMIASYLLSSTLVPVLSVWLLRTSSGHGHRGLLAYVEGAYARLVGRVARHRAAALVGYAVLCLPAMLIVGRLGTELFPRAGSDLIQVRIRAPDGTRLERTENIVRGVEQTFRDELGADRVGTTLANIGNPPWSYPVNALYVFNAGPHEAVLLASLNKPAHGHAEPLAQTEERLRNALRERFPSVRFAFEPGDIVSQVLDFGAAAPIHVTVSGSDLSQTGAFARRIQSALARLDELRDVQIQESLDYPTLHVAVDRERAGELDLTTAHVVRSVLDATSSSVVTTQMFWTDPRSGTPYRVAVRVPEHQLTSEDDVLGLPVMRGGTERTLVRDVATVHGGTTPGVVDRVGGQRTIGITANPFGADLGRAAAKVDQTLRAVGAPPRGVTVAVRGQVSLMRSTLASMRVGLVLSALVIFLLLAAQFQSFREPAMVLAMVPAVLAGVVYALATTGTTLNVQSLIGAITSIGVSVANAVLLLSFARERHARGEPRAVAAVEAARGRLRPIVMTTLAMIAGMMPTALGFGEAGEQSAPIGRAVIGGLLASTVATLVLLPSIYATFASPAVKTVSLHPDEVSS